ncbi:hypothetical protein D3C84_390450 [compost metagenome]
MLYEYALFEITHTVQQPRSLCDIQAVKVTGIAQFAAALSCSKLYDVFAFTPIDPAFKARSIPDDEEVIAVAQFQGYAFCCRVSRINFLEHRGISGDKGLEPADEVCLWNLTLVLDHFAGDCRFNVIGWLLGT